MRRNFIGSTLAVLLLAVIAMKQIALGFCLCDASYFLDACDCHEETPAVLDCSDDCCPDHHDSDESELPDPCDDCETSVVVDPGDFAWSPLDDLTPSFDVADLPKLTDLDPQVFDSATNFQATASPRGSPPGSCATFLRHQSLRL